MPAKNVDAVFVIDASASMAPCFSQVVENVEHMMKSLHQASFHTRLDVLVHNIPAESVYHTSTVKEANAINALYHSNRPNFFTEDLQEFCRKLKSVSVKGDEDMLVALDCALDFPFGPISSTQRVVVLLSDEPFETNYDFDCRKGAVDQLIEKIHSRKITLLMVMPHSDTANILAEADKSDYAALDNSDDGLRSFDFKRFFAQLGKTLSSESRQITKEKEYRKALFGQDRWGLSSGYEAPVGDRK